MSPTVVFAFGFLLFLGLFNEHAKADEYEDYHQYEHKAIHNPFEPFFEEEEDLFPKPKTWKEIVNRMKELSIDFDDISVYFPPNWKYCMKNHRRTHCNTYFKRMFELWPWSKRFLPKNIY